MNTNQSSCLAVGQKWGWILKSCFQNTKVWVCAFDMKIHVLWEAKVSESICFLFRVLQNCHDDASKFLHLLAKPGCPYLEQEDFIPFLQVWRTRLERVSSTSAVWLACWSKKKKSIVYSNNESSLLVYHGSLITFDMKPNNTFSKCCFV